MSNKCNYQIGEFINGIKYLGEANNGRKIRECIFECKYCKVPFITRLTSIKNGNTSSCGCYKKIALSKRVKTHGQTLTIEYRSWQSMKDRCLNENNKRYKHYGGRGIKICESWLISFENFLEDMGERPSIKYTLERIDTNKDYYKENCKWATKKEQNRNRTITRYVFHNDKKVPFSELVEKSGVNYDTAMYRYQKGMDLNKVFDYKI